MAIFIAGMKCPLCGKQMFADQAVRGFKPFVSDPDDPLYVFSDAIVHEQCFLNEKRSAAVEERYNAFLEATAQRPPICRASGKPITHPDDYLCLGFFTEDSSEPLHQLNWAHFSKQALSQWPERDSLLALLEAARSNPRMYAAGIEWLIKEIQRPQGTKS